MPTTMLNIEGRTYKATWKKGRPELIHVRGPLEAKRPHRALWDAGEWLDMPGLAGYYDRAGERVKSFYSAANEVIAAVTAERSQPNPKTQPTT